MNTLNLKHLLKLEHLLEMTAGSVLIGGDSRS